ncbi:hypothetical protein GGI04_003973, partial [Coemansia thaxteri]
MKLLPATVVFGIIATAHAHYECTPQEAFDVLFNNATTNVLAERLLDTLKKGVVQLRSDLSQTSAENIARAIMDRYRSIIGKLPKDLAVN